MQQPRADNGQFISWETFIMSIIDERFDAIRRENVLRFEAIHREDALNQKALDLQAIEYERRLTDLNHAHARAQELQATFLREDKWEDQKKSETEARELALARIDERLRDLDKAVDTAEGAAQAAKQMALEQGRKSNRNIGIASIVLAAVLAIARWLGVA